MNHFIKLPDGTIINVAHVRRVEACNNKYSDVSVNSDLGHKHKYQEYDDVYGDVYKYFNNIAQEIGGDDMKSIIPSDGNVERLETTNAELLEALMEIAKGEGAFSLDQFTFANNTIENMKDIANTAIAKAEAKPCE